MLIPDALREAYTHTGLLNPRSRYVEDGVLAFHWSDPLITETTWGIPLDAIGRPDPPVIIDTGSGWQPYIDRLSLACVDIALTAAIDMDVLANAAELSPEQEPMVAVHFDRVPLPDLPMWVEVEESPVRWYSRPGQLVRVHGENGAWAWVRGQAPADLDAIYTALPGASWSH